MTTATEYAGIRPVDDRVLIAQDPAETVHPNGLAIVNPEPDNRGTVLAHGPGRHDARGVLIPMPVTVGDRVVFPEVAGSTITASDGTEYLLIAAPDLLAVETPDADGMRTVMPGMPLPPFADET